MCFASLVLKKQKRHVQGMIIITLTTENWAGPCSAVGRAPDSQVRGSGFDTRSGHILSFLLLLIQEGLLSDTGESMCMKYWLTA